jgi:hypothetical protein
MNLSGRPAGGGDATQETLRLARDILEHRGSAWRANKNAAMLVATDGPTLAKARASARTLAALRDLKADRHRLGRFNAEQREQLDKRLAATEERLPQQVAMAYRHLLLLGEADHGGTQLDHVDLGPARVDARIGDRVLDYLRAADRLVETTLAPAALLAARFGLLPEGTDAVELDTLLGYFARLPRLPKLAGAQVLRAALAEGVAKGLFGLASGSSWDAEDAVLRFGEPLDPARSSSSQGRSWCGRQRCERCWPSGEPVSESLGPDRAVPPRLWHRRMGARPQQNRRDGPANRACPLMRAAEPRVCCPRSRCTSGPFRGARRAMS